MRLDERLEEPLASIPGTYAEFCSRMLQDRKDARFEIERLRDALHKARNTLAGLGYPSIAADICDAALKEGT